MKEEAEYDTIKELKKAIENNEIEGCEPVLTLDNDCVSAYHWPEQEGPDKEILYYRKSGSPRQVLEEALDILGIKYRRP